MRFGYTQKNNFGTDMDTRLFFYQVLCVYCVLPVGWFILWRSVCWLVNCAIVSSSISIPGHLLHWLVTSSFYLICQFYSSFLSLNNTLQIPPGPLQRVHFSSNMSQPISLSSLYFSYSRSFLHYFTLSSTSLFLTSSIHVVYSILLQTHIFSKATILFRKLNNK